jgi:hypothetical protein
LETNGDKLPIIGNFPGSHDFTRTKLSEDFGYNSGGLLFSHPESKISITKEIYLGLMATKFPKFSQDLAADPTTRRIWYGIATAHDFESHDGMTEENLY